MRQRIASTRARRGTMAVSSALRPTAVLEEVASGSYLIRMRAVGLKVLKDRLSEYIRIVSAGETVLVTDRDRIVAKIVPPYSGRAPLVADALLAEAVRRGWISPPALAADPPPPAKPVMTLGDIMGEPQRARAGRWSI